MVTPAAKREAVAHLAFCVRHERAAGVQDDRLRADDGEISVPAGPTTQNYRRLRSLARARRRFGYRRLHVLLRRESFTVNHKRLFRLYRAGRLMVRRARASREPPSGPRARRPIAVLFLFAMGSKIDRWSLDLSPDGEVHTTEGRRLRILVAGRSLHRECLVAGSRHFDLRHPSGPQGLNQLIVAYGKPTTSSETTSTRARPRTPSYDGQTTTRSGWHYIAPASRFRMPSPVAHQSLARRAAQ